MIGNHVRKYNCQSLFLYHGLVTLIISNQVDGPETPGADEFLRLESIHRLCLKKFRSVNFSAADIWVNCARL